MNKNNLKVMRGFIKKYFSIQNVLVKKPKILDVGSFDVNGSYRELFRKEEVTYTGIDIRSGKGVDIVLDKPYVYPFKANTFDLVISGATLEHMTRPWQAIKEMKRVLKKGSFIFLIVPIVHKIHKYPLDCFRILPDGMRSMMQDAGLTVVYCEACENEITTFGVGLK